MNYENDKNIKWVYAQKVDGGEWVCKRLSASVVIQKPIDESDMFESVQIGEMKRSEFAIFRNRPDWANYRPFRYLDCRDKSNFRICGLSGLINSLDSSWF